MRVRRWLGLAADSLRPFGQVARSRDLRRCELALVGFGIGEWATWIAMLIFAFDAGGPTATGVVAVIQLAPSALVAPFAAALGDRFRRRDVMVGAYAIQSALMGATAAALLTSAPIGVVYALAAGVATSITLTRPTQAGLVASIARTPQELVAANVTSGIIQNVSVLTGPAVAAAILSASGPGVVFAVTAGILLWSALLVSRVEGLGGAVVRRSAGIRDTARHALGGFRNLATKPAPRLLVALLSAQAVVWGALDVLLVVLALDVLGLHRSGVGVLTGALGAGGLVGSIGAVALVGRRRLSPALSIGAVVWGLPLAAIALAGGAGAAVGLIAAAGAGRTLMDVAGRTLLQRIVPNHLLARVFGVLEGVYVASLAVGSICAPALVRWLGARGAFAVAGLALPVLTLFALGRLRRIDASADVPQEALELLRGIPMFAQMSAPMIEPLAINLAAELAAAGDRVITKGERGDRFYVIESGQVEVRDGRSLAVRGPGEFFGEISLLRNVPRTADVVALTEVALRTLDRETFIEAVTGRSESVAAADQVVEDRLRRPER